MDEPSGNVPAGVDEPGVCAGMDDYIEEGTTITIGEQSWWVCFFFVRFVNIFSASHHIIIDL
jgi:hypothetical protein